MPSRLLSTHHIFREIILHSNTQQGSKHLDGGKRVKAMLSKLVFPFSTCLIAFRLSVARRLSTDDTGGMSTFFALM